MIKHLHLFFSLTALPLFVFTQTSTLIKPAIKQKANTSNSLSLLPYNRWIRSAGKVITFGDSTLENHALDVCLLPDKKFLAIEDRYGIVLLDIQNNSIYDRWSFQNNFQLKDMMSTYSGITSFYFKGKIFIAWGAGTSQVNGSSAIVIAEWNGHKINNVSAISFNKIPPADQALPNQVVTSMEEGVLYLYTVLNGNNQLVKIRFEDRKIIWTSQTGVAPYGLCIVSNKIYVSNWAGPIAKDKTREVAGVPWGAAYIDPATGATSKGTVSIFDIVSGKEMKEVEVGLHPTSIIYAPPSNLIYVSNGNSDFVSVLDPRTDKVIDSINTGLFSAMNLIGSSPNALAIDKQGFLYVANGMDNALLKIKPAQYQDGRKIKDAKVLGLIPTEAYPGGLLLFNNKIYIANIEAKGSKVLTRASDITAEDESSQLKKTPAFTPHRELASMSVIDNPSDAQLKNYTVKVQMYNLINRAISAQAAPRKNISPRPVPERVGEPSVFKHVVYIIKENKTYDQVFGDLKSGRGASDLCVFGNSITPNQHRLAIDFSLLDNYYCSGKSSAEGHQWTDAAMVTDYIEKSVRAWFRSYPHRQYDALVYGKYGFIWNHALDHGKKVRIYGEACFTEFDEKLSWTEIYQKYLNHQPFTFRNTTTISRVKPILSQNYPGYDNPKINDQLRAAAFIEEWKSYEKKGGDSLPDLMIIALPNDHTAGTTPGFPTPRAMVADNDLALGKIIDAISHSRFWDSTVVFVTEDDSQSGWDHISAYRTTSLVISPYSVVGKTVHTNYNQTSMVRTIEQILGLPPMNVIDATAEPMFDCFATKKKDYHYTFLPNRISLQEMNKNLSQLRGTALKMARLSADIAFKVIDSGEDDAMNRILWFSLKGDIPYPGIK